MAMDIDLQVRVAAFNWLTEQVNLHGDVLSRKLLEQGFEFQGSRIPLVAPQGIFKPQILDLPLSITTAPKGPYDDYLGVTPDYVIHVREDILVEEDGPVLQHGLKGLHHSKIILPSSKSSYPNRDALAWRYSRFARSP